MRMRKVDEDAENIQATDEVEDPEVGKATEAVGGADVNDDEKTAVNPSGTKTSIHIELEMSAEGLAGETTEDFQDEEVGKDDEEAGILEAEINSEDADAKDAKDVEVEEDKATESTQEVTEPFKTEIIETEDGITLKISLNQDGINSFINSIPDANNFFNEFPNLGDIPDAMNLFNKLPNLEDIP
jgi:hypothetical protein